MKNSDKFGSTVSHNSPWGNAGLNWTPETTGSGSGSGSGTGTGTGSTDTGNSGKLGTEIVNGVVTITDSILDLFRKPDTNNTYYITQGDEGKKDNTMLYVGIGGVILVVILFIVIAIKK